MSAPIILKIDVTKIPREAIFQGQRGKYVDLIVYENDQPDQYGNSHSVQLSQTKEQRERKDKKVYVGNGKPLFKPKGDGGAWSRQGGGGQRRPNVPPAREQASGEVEEDDIPF